MGIVSQWGSSGSSGDPIEEGFVGEVGFGAAATAGVVSWWACHTAPIGNLGMRTHATRHGVATVPSSHVHGLIRCAFLDHHLDLLRRGGLAGPLPADGIARSSSWACGDDAHAETPGEFGGFGVVAEDEEDRVGLTGESGEAHGGAAFEDGGAIEDDGGEGAAAEEDVGAPGAARGAIGAHDPESGFAVDELSAGVRPVLRGEGAGGVDVGDGPSGGDGAFDHGADDGGLAAAGGADEFGESAAGEAVAGECGVECLEAGAQAGGGRVGAVDDVGELLAEEGERHESEYRIKTERARMSNFHPFR